VLRALNTLITETSSPSSLFHPSHAGRTTDARIYPAPVPSDSSTTNGEQTPPTKKRRLEALADGLAPAPANDIAGARYPASVHANDHLAQVHDIIKKECEELARNCASPSNTVILGTGWLMKQCIGQG
jgi:proteasome activator subunit 3 (PA28 gamma)